MKWRRAAERARQRSSVLLVVAAVVLSVGYAVEHDQADLVDAELRGEARPLRGDPDGRVSRALLTTPEIATRLSASGAIDAPAGTIARYVSFSLPWPNFVVRTAAPGAGFAEAVGRAWIVEANALFVALLNLDATERRDTLRRILRYSGPSVITSAADVLRRERRRFGQRDAFGGVGGADAFVVSGTAASVSDRIPGFSSLVLWLAAALLAAGLTAAAPGRSR